MVCEVVRVVVAGVPGVVVCEVVVEVGVPRFVWADVIVGVP